MYCIILQVRVLQAWYYPGSFSSKGQQKLNQKRYVRIIAICEFPSEEYGFSLLRVKTRASLAIHTRCQAFVFS